VQTIVACRWPLVLRPERQVDRVNRPRVTRIDITGGVLESTRAPPPKKSPLFMRVFAAAYRVKPKISTPINELTAITFFRPPWGWKAADTYLVNEQSIDSIHLHQTHIFFSSSGRYLNVCSIERYFFALISNAI